MALYPTDHGCGCGNFSDKKLRWPRCCIQRSLEFTGFPCYVIDDPWRGRYSTTLCACGLGFPHQRFYDCFLEDACPAFQTMRRLHIMRERPRTVEQICTQSDIFAKCISLPHRSWRSFSCVGSSSRCRHDMSFPSILRIPLSVIWRPMPRGQQ